jgi:glucose/arabinose dehydrogenase
MYLQYKAEDLRGKPVSVSYYVLSDTNSMLTIHDRIRASEARDQALGESVRLNARKTSVRVIIYLDMVLEENTVVEFKKIFRNLPTGNYKKN